MEEADIPAGQQRRVAWLRWRKTLFRSTYTKDRPEQDGIQPRDNP